jgi:di/tricarboxylate transporter
VTWDQGLIAGLLVVVLALFALGRWRHDVVAFFALVSSVLLGLVPAEEAFAGFGHPATITVAAVLVLSRALSTSGATDVLVRRVMALATRPSVHIGALSGLGAALSTFMNNVGALALLMPVALQSAAKAERSPSMLLMPLAFASILGGLVTLIGTPPNIIVATYRGESIGSPFAMFDFAPVGGVVALAGLAFIVLIGWRLVPTPRGKGSAEDFFAIEDYISEARVGEDSKVAGKTLRELEELAEDADVQIVGLIRGGRRMGHLARWEKLREGDVLVLEAGPSELDQVVSKLDLQLLGPDEREVEEIEGDSITLVECVVGPRSAIEGRTAESLGLPWRWGVNLLAVSRQGQPHRGRLRSFRFHIGDVLLLQGDQDRLGEVVRQLGCLPLAHRDMPFGKRGRAWLAVLVFVAAIATAASGLLPFPIALGIGALATVVTGIVPARELYDAIDWPVIVLLGAMIPVGGALETTGLTEVIADRLFDLAQGLPPAAILALLIVVTMTLSDIMNNAATAVVMAPLALAIATRLGHVPDAHLMAVAIGASCAFLTPIGHQNNTLVMGPGGYSFGSYWRMGLPLEVVIVGVAVPMLLLVWPVG